MPDVRRTNRRGWSRIALALGAACLTGCATSSSLQLGERAERVDDFDRAVVEYTKAVRAKPDDPEARAALDRARVRASQEHYFKGRRLAAEERYEEAVVELRNEGDAIVAHEDVGLRRGCWRAGKEHANETQRRDRGRCGDASPPVHDVRHGAVSANRCAADVALHVTC